MSFDLFINMEAVKLVFVALNKLRFVKTITMVYCKICWAGVTHWQTGGK